jgi:hypothetical protein
MKKVENTFEGFTNFGNEIFSDISSISNLLCKRRHLLAKMIANRSRTRSHQNIVDAITLDRQCVCYSYIAARMSVLFNTKSLPLVGNFTFVGTVMMVTTYFNRFLYFGFEHAMFWHCNLAH